MYKPSDFVGPDELFPAGESDLQRAQPTAHALRVLFTGPINVLWSEEDKQRLAAIEQYWMPTVRAILKPAIEAKFAEVKGYLEQRQINCSKMQWSDELELAIAKNLTDCDDPNHIASIIKFLGGSHDACAILEPKELRELGKQIQAELSNIPLPPIAKAA